MSIPKRKLDDSEAWRILDESIYGTLCCILEDGTPYATPVNAYLDPTDKCLYFHCKRKGMRANAIKNNPNVCFVVANNVSVEPERYTTWYESAQVFGTAEILEDKEDIIAVHEMICEKYSPNQTQERKTSCLNKYLPALSACKITPKKVSAKQNHDD